MDSEMGKWSKLPNNEPTFSEASLDQGTTAAKRGKSTTYP